MVMISLVKWGVSRYIPNAYIILIAPSIFFALMDLFGFTFPLWSDFSVTFLKHHLVISLLSTTALPDSNSLSISLVGLLKFPSVWGYSSKGNPKSVALIAH